MIRTLGGATLGLLLGVILAASVNPFVGIVGFSESNSSIALGYACCLSIGALVGLAAGKESGFSNRSASAGVGAASALLLAYVFRELPLPWANLVWLDGTAGPMSELPFVLLPVVGLILGSGFGAAREKAAP